MAQLAVEGVRKRFGHKTVLHEISFAVEPGGCLALLGPSGSGKSTILNLIAGFEQPDAGDILVRGGSVVQLPPHRRRIGVVFQQYALFPHLNVAENIAYPLVRKRVATVARGKRVQQLLEAVQLGGYEHQSVQTLSGGQQQRVAIARALAAEPDILLMDEPMGALDRTLRDELQVELKALLRQAAITVVYVTHDQREAIALAEQIAVLNEGRIEQIGDTEAIFAAPRTAFVARFLWPASFSLFGTAEKVEGESVRLRIGSSLVSGTWMKTNATALKIGDAVEMVLRPQQIRILPAAHENSVVAEITEAVFSGDHRTVQLRLTGGEQIMAHQPLAAHWKAGDKVHASWDAGHVFVPRAGGDPR
jgi:ABC-type Fe3+/spermidine/putrescine transport system ATPase subunit